MSAVETSIGRIVWHELVTPDVERAHDFYAQLLGWETQVFKPGEADYRMIMANGQAHGGFLSNEQAQNAPPAWITYVFVEDPEETARTVAEAGGTVVHGPMQIPDVGTIVVLADPQGAVIAAIGRTDGEMPVPQGVFVWDELSTSDVEGAKPFYAAVFGWTAEEMDMAGMGTYTVFSRGDAQLGGAMAAMPGDPSPPHWTTYIGVDDVDATVDRARSLGATVHVEATEIPGTGRFAIIGEPTGAAVGLYRSAG